MKLHARNISSLFGFDAVVRLLGFAATAYLARVLGSEQFGVINLGLAVFSYGTIVTSPGLHIIGTRIVSQQREGETGVIARITWLRSVLSVGAGIIIAAGSWFLVADRFIRLTIVLYSASLLPYALQIGWYFQGRQRIAAIGLSQSVSFLVFVILLSLLVTSSADVLAVPVVFFVSTAINAGLLYWFHLRERSATADGESVTEPSPGWKSLLWQAIPVGAASIMAQFALNLPVILLGFFAATSDIGDFSVASKLVFFLLVIDRAIYVLFYPFVSRTYAADPTKLGGQVQRILGYILVLTLPICVGGALLSGRLITLLFGPGYESSSPLLQILIFYFLFTILNSIFAYVIIAAGKERRYSVIVVGISTILFAALIPLTYCWKGIGASYGMVGGELAIMTLMYRECRKLLPPKLTAAALKPAIGSVIMGLFLLSSPHVELFSSIGVGILIYFSCMVLLRGITKEDVVFLKERLI